MRRKTIGFLLNGFVRFKLATRSMFGTPTGNKRIPVVVYKKMAQLIGGGEPCSRTFCIFNTPQIAINAEASVEVFEKFRRTSRRSC